MFIQCFGFNQKLNYYAKREQTGECAPANTQVIHLRRFVIKVAYLNSTTNIHQYEKVRISLPVN